MQTIFARDIAIEVLQTIYLKADIAVATFAKEYIAEEVIAIQSFAKEYIAIKILQSNFEKEDTAIEVFANKDITIKVLRKKILRSKLLRKKMLHSHSPVLRLK